MTTIIKMKILKDFRTGYTDISLMFFRPWQMTVYTKRSPEILPGILFPSLFDFPVKSPSWRLHSGNHKSFSIFPCAEFFKPAMGFIFWATYTKDKFRVWCHRTGTCSLADKWGAKLLAQSNKKIYFPSNIKSRSPTMPRFCLSTLQA